MRVLNWMRADFTSSATIRERSLARSRATRRRSYKFDTHAGERYFVREDVESSGLTTSVRFTLKNAAVAEDEIQECSRQGIKQ